MILVLVEAVKNIKNVVDLNGNKLSFDKRLDLF